MIETYIKVRDKVLHILENCPTTRDCDRRLYLALLVLFYDFKDEMKTSTPYMTFKNIWLNPKIPCFESVSRARRKIQEIYPHLRGMRREERKKAEVKAHEFFRESSYVED